VVPARGLVYDREASRKGPHTAVFRIGTIQSGGVSAAHQAMLRHRRFQIAPAMLLIASCLCGAPLVCADEGGESRTPEAGSSAKRTFSLGERWALKLLPIGHLYPIYIADPRRSTFSAQYMDFSRSDIPEAGSVRNGLKLGARFGILLFHPKEDPGRGVQINLEAGYSGLFDKSRTLDNIGYDGMYGLIVSYRPRGRLQYLFGLHHTSSHIGDEYIENTGRKRHNYSREEFRFGLSGQATKHLTLYGEGGYDYDLRDEEVQEAGRAQAGLQYDAQGTFWKGRLGWYAAADGTAFEEDDWSVNLTVQAGIVMRAGQRAWRFGVEHYDGRSLMGEFFLEDESYTALGLWLDL